MYTEKSKETRGLVTGFVIGQVVLGLILGVFIIRVFFPGTTRMGSDERGSLQLTINSLQEYIPWIGEDEISYMQNILFDKVKRNTEGLNVKDTEVEIREGTLKVYNNEQNDIGHLSMIVDLPELSQSYQIFYEYPDREIDMGRSVVALCVEVGQEIYDGFQCTGREEDDEWRKIVVDMYLEEEEFEGFTVDMSDDLRIITINPQRIELVGEGEKMIDEVKNIVDNLGVSSNNFEYNLIDLGDLTYEISDD